MPMTPSKKRLIRQAADQQAARAPEGAERAQAVKDARAVLGKLNRRIEKRMDTLELELVQILSAYAPGRAGLVAGMSKRIMEHTRATVQTLMVAIDQCDGAPIRLAVAGALADLLPACRDAAQDSELREDVRKGVRVD